MLWDEAAASYREAMVEFPENVQALSNLAAALLELKEYEEALDIYQQVVRISPNDPLPLEKMSQIDEFQEAYGQSSDVSTRAAELHLKNKDVEKSIENFTRAIQLAPDNLKVRSRLALIYERMGRKLQAVTEYLAVASLLQHAGQKDRAIQLVNHTLTLDPNNDKATQALGLLRANQPLPKPVGRKPAIVKKLEIAAPESYPQLQKAEHADEEGEPIAVTRKKALSDLAALMFDQDDASTLQRGGARSSIQMLTKGTGPLSQVTVERTKIMLHLSQAVDFQSRGHNVDAAGELEKAIDAGLDNAAAYFDLGLLRSENGQLESAIRKLQQAVNHPVYALAARLLLGQILLKMNRIHDSGLQFLEALKLADSSLFSGTQADSLQQLYDPIIDAYYQKPDNDRDAKLCETINGMLSQKDWRNRVKQARQQLPDPVPGAPPIPLAEFITEAQSSQVVELLSRSHMQARQGLYRTAMEETFWALHFAPTYLPLHAFMGEVLLEQDQYQEAITKFNTVARAYSSRGEASRAIEIYRRVTQLAPLDLNARQRLVEQLTAAGLIDETVREYIYLGDVFYRLAELEKAREAYQKALSVSQRSNLASSWTVEVLHHLADIDLQRLDWKRALRIYEQIKGIDPNDMKACLNVIELNLRMMEHTQAFAELGNQIAYLNRNGNLEQAIEMLNVLVQNHPDVAGLHRNLAEVYQQAGKNAEAIDEWDRLADLLVQDGDKSGAIQAIKAIIALAPANVDEYRQVLAELGS